MPLLPLAGLAMLVLALAGGLMLVRAQMTASERVRHTLIVELQIGEVLEQVRKVESSQRGYLIAGDPAYPRDMAEAVDRLGTKLVGLRTLIADNPAQRRMLVVLDRLVVAKVAFARAGVDLASTGERQRAIGLVGTGRGQALIHAIERTTATMKRTEAILLERRIAHVRRAVWWLVAGQIAALLLVLAVAALTLRDARLRFHAAEDARDDAREAADLIAREMAARETAEAQVRQLQKMESIGQLTGGIAHDFNNMLAVVIGSLDMARRRIDDGPERLSRYIDNAREGADRAATLTARLLAFSRQQPLTPVAVDVNRLVAGLSEMLGRTLGERIAVDAVLADGLWPTFVDPSQLENAILNLAVNARDAMGGGDGRLMIETRNVTAEAAAGQPAPPAGDHVLIAVGDTGEGMPAEVVARAFEPFFTTKAVGKGTGLGLAQVFGFINQSGGHVAIESTVGAGTTVRLYLPRHTGSTATTRALAADGIPEGRSDEIILVVEDEQQVRHFSVDALRELGYTAISAADGREALALLEENRSIRLLFTDVVMPEMDGRRLAQAARAIRPSLRVLYTTGYSRHEPLEPGVAMLAKPFTVAQLARRIRETIDAADGG